MSEQRSPEKSNWLTRLREWVRPSRGDTIIANVQDSRDVIVGKNIIKVGTLVVPAVPVFIGIVVLLIVVATLAYLRFVPDRLDRNSFGVAVAQFGELGADQHVITTDASQAFSRTVFVTLRDELEPLAKNLPGQLKPIIWHDSLFPLQIRRQIGVVAGTDAKGRRATAKQLANDLGAKMLIYGNLDTTQTPPMFTPEFYVETLSGEADEASGRYQFGAPIPVRLSSLAGTDWAQSLTLTEAMNARQKVLTQIAIGLTYDLDGQHDKALATFQAALGAIPAEDRAGEEVVHFFIGREYLFLANNAQVQAESLTAQGKVADAQAAAARIEPLLVNAENEFNLARKTNDTYARARYGLAAVYRLRTLRQSPPDRISQPAFLNRALSEYQIALNSALQDGEVEIQIKVRVAIGTAYFLKGEAFLNRQDWQNALNAFDESIQRTEAELPKLGDWVRSQGEAYLTLGNAYFEKGIVKEQMGDQAASQTAYREAIKKYSECIKLRAFEKTLAEGAAARCERYQAQVQARLK